MSKLSGCVDVKVEEDCSVGLAVLVTASRLGLGESFYNSFSMAANDELNKNIVIGEKSLTIPEKKEIAHKSWKRVDVYPNYINLTFN